MKPKTHYRMPRKRVKPRRKRPELFGHDHGLRLRGKAKTEQRRLIFERSKGRCEDVVADIDPKLKSLRMDFVATLTGGFSRTRRCNLPITWESMEWSHNRHSANKCDCLKCGIASCHDCHARKHNSGGKPCPKKESPVTAISAHAGTS